MSQEDAHNSCKIQGWSSNPEDSDHDQCGESDTEKTWFPGDGICPPTSEFLACCRASYQLWAHAASSPRPDDGLLITRITRAFVRMLENVPRFLYHPPKNVEVLGTSGTRLTVQPSLRMRTTEDMDCTQHYKWLDVVQCLGVPVPKSYEMTTMQQQEISLTSAPLKRGHLTSIVLAWSYILSCRWVEILQEAGWNASIQHEKGLQIADSFWKNLKLQKCWARSSASLSAFEMLLGSCISEGLEAELLTGLASVLMLLSRNERPWLSPPTSIPKTPTTPASTCSARSHALYKLWGCLDKAMYLSSTRAAIESLIRSAFFDSSVPCDLLGASFSGIREALSSADEFDPQRALHAITNRRPHLSPLWAAEICMDPDTLSYEVLDCLPPICLPAALWTGTMQSFLQVAYRSDEPADLEAKLLRAREFQIAYFCQPSIPVPETPAPPFGETILNNVSREVETHMAHEHMTRSWQMYWTTKSGAKKPATAQYVLELVEARMEKDVADYNFDEE
ncbi:hypothetical protein AnigIFM63604_007235 [Aspergillus niger]|uniref:Uncharacterized protein n=1 Tax=Aspergillus niger TaxID=5061 RepID=A0A9W6A4T2_ASPNG|nr:hypothetical protein AnigIFM63604_007235 [Aspergillus niger]